VRDEVEEPAQCLGVHLHVPALRTAADSTALALDRGLELALDVLAHRLHPLAAEGAPECGDAVGVERVLDGLDVVLGGGRLLVIIVISWPLGS
jgi:hypothetical protein